MAVLAATPATAKAPEAAGWWSRAQQAPVMLPLPIPPSAEPGELVVADAPDEPAAIAAVRFVLTAEETQPILTLREVDSANATALRLEACPATTRWEPADGGRWADRPEFDCERGRAPGGRADDGSWQFDLSLLLDEDTLDVVIVPAAPTDGTPRQAGFVRFAKPGEDALATVEALPALDDFGIPESPPEVFNEFLPVDPVSGAPFDLGPVAPEQAAAAVLTRPALTPPLSASRVPVPISDTGRAWLAALILFAGCAAGASRLGNERHVVLLRASHLLRSSSPRTADAEPVMAGVARFTRVRSGSPPPLN
ncbi:MAG TPA: hypothetical protein VNB24_03520 [Acidimicrobiales bacterium]|nr:hypothetical protein [Acidimicrobiales bacterium]